MSIEPMSQSLEGKSSVNEQFQTYTKTCTCKISRFKQYDDVNITEWTPELLINFWTSVCRFQPSARPIFDNKELKLLESYEPGFFQSFIPSNQSACSYKPINPNIFVSAAKYSEQLRRLGSGSVDLEGNQVLSKDAETILRRHSYELEPFLRQGAIHIDNVAKRIDTERTKALRTLGQNILVYLKENPITSVDLIWTSELFTKFMDSLSKLQKDKKLAFDRASTEFYNRPMDQKILGEDKICLDVMRHVTRTLHLMTLIIGLNKKNPQTLNPILVADAEKFVKFIDLVKETITKQAKLYNALGESEIAREWGSLHKEFFPSSRPRKPVEAIKQYYSCPIATQEPNKRAIRKNRVLKWGATTKKTVTNKAKLVEESVTKILEKKKVPPKKKVVMTGPLAEGEVDETPSPIKPSKMSPRAADAEDSKTSQFTRQLQKSISDKQLRRYSTSEVEMLKREGKLEGLFDPSHWEQEDKKIETKKLERRNSFVEVMARNLLEQLPIMKMLKHASKLEKVTQTAEVADTPAGEFELIPDEQDLEWEA